MRHAALIVIAIALVGCQSKTTKDQELCAKAAAMFERCEDLGVPANATGSDKLARELVIDRWRGLCRAVFTGETKQLLPNALELFQQMDEETKAALRKQAECAAKTDTCTAYAGCE